MARSIPSRLTSGGAEGALPHVVAEHDHAGCSRHFIGVEQGTTAQGRHTCRAERGGGELRYLDRLGTARSDRPGSLTRLTLTF